MLDLNEFDYWALEYAPSSRKECADAWNAAIKHAESVFQLPSLEECKKHVNEKLWCGCAKGTSESLIELLYDFISSRQQKHKKLR